MNPKEVFHNTAYTVQLPYIAGHSLYNVLCTVHSKCIYKKTIPIINQYFFST